MGGTTTTTSIRSLGGFDVRADEEDRVAASLALRSEPVSSTAPPEDSSASLHEGFELGTLAPSKVFDRMLRCRHRRDVAAQMPQQVFDRDYHSEKFSYLAALHIRVM